MYSELKHRLLQDLKSLGVPTAFDLELKGFSASHYGKYDPNKNKITLYVYQTPDGAKLFDYPHIFKILLHECVHYLQWKDSSFVRRKGVMHDPAFHRLFNEYKMKAEKILKEVTQ